MSRRSPHPVMLRQLQYAVAVAEFKSFRRAAEACAVAQPSLSAQVAQLEGALGLPIFERSARGVAVTKNGAALLERARRTLLDADDLLATAERSRDPLSGTLNIGVTPTVAPYLLPEISPARSVRSDRAEPVPEVDNVHPSDAGGRSEKYRLNPFDVTKVWSHKDYPRIEVGEIVLNRNPENYFADVEQAAFAPSSVVPGLGFSPDRMLQGRLFAYADAHRYRLGVNYHQIPVNRPLNQAKHYHRDGSGRSDGNGGATPNYHPNSFDEVGELTDARSAPYAVSGALDRHNHRGDEDYYSQAGDLYRLMNEEQRALLASNIAGALQSVPEFIQKKQLAHFEKADHQYAERVLTELNKLSSGDPNQVPVTK